MLEVKNITVRYGAVQAIQSVSLDVGAGEIVALIGANGAGKSTLLNAISGVVSSCAGDVLLKGRPITGIAPHKVASAGVVQVPEGRQVFRDMTVLENLEMGGFLRRASENRETLATVLKMFPRLRERSTQLAGLLSGGEQQMLAIGRALMAKPKILLLDEPSMGLAPLIVAEIFRQLAEFNRVNGQPILLVEQNARAALRMAHRAYVLANGKIQRSGRASELLHDDQVKAAFLGQNRASPTTRVQERLVVA